MSGYALHPDAYRDIDEIWEFIARDSISAADRLRDDIYTTVCGLVPFPFRGHQRSDITSGPIRFV